MLFIQKVKSVVAVAVVLTSISASAQNLGLHILKKYPIKSSGGWDYITVDASEKKMYVSHGRQVNILSTETGDSLGVIPNTNGVHGIALVKSLGKGYTSNGMDNSCTVFDLKTNAAIRQIAVGTNPDAIFYDDFSKEVYVFNGKSKDASVIDPGKDQVVATIALGGKPETGVSDGKGKIFVNSETTNEIVVINASTYKVIKRYKINDGDEPSGLAIDRASNRLFIGCGGNATMVVMDASNGKNLANLKIGDCDGVAFDPALKLAYSSNGDGTLSVIKEENANKFVFVENIPTEKSARTIGIDLTTHHLFLPAAQMEATPPTAENAHPRPQMTPGSFHILEIGQ
jgi:YVTN family beta-propeller protein